METAKDILNQELLEGAIKIIAAIKAANYFGRKIDENEWIDLEEEWYDWLKEFITCNG